MPSTPAVDNLYKALDLAKDDNPDFQKLHHFLQESTRHRLAFQECVDELSKFKQLLDEVYRSSKINDDCNDAAVIAKLKDVHRVYTYATLLTPAINLFEDKSPVYGTWYNPFNLILYPCKLAYSKFRQVSGLSYKSLLSKHFGYSGETYSVRKLVEDYQTETGESFKSTSALKASLAKTTTSWPFDQLLDEPYGIYKKTQSLLKEIWKKDWSGEAEQLTPLVAALGLAATSSSEDAGKVFKRLDCVSQALADIEPQIFLGETGYAMTTIEGIFFSAREERKQQEEDLARLQEPAFTNPRQQTSKTIHLETYVS